MTQQIDQEKLREAAEHLEWVLSRYPNDATIKSIWEGLADLIDSAKLMRFKEVMPGGRFPYSREFSDGIFSKYKDPNLEDAYCKFATEAEGGYSNEEMEIIEKIRSYMVARNG